MTKVKRIRRVDTRKEMDRAVDDFATTGYEIMEQGEHTTMLRYKTWGTLLWHFVVAVLTIWWTFGVGNVIYALAARYAIAEKILVTINEPEEAKKEVGAS